MTCLATGVTTSWFLDVLSIKKILSVFTVGSIDWKPEPIHGLHTRTPVLGTVTLFLWCFILLVAFAPPEFQHEHPQLIFFNILLPFLILLLSIIGDRSKLGHFHTTIAKYRLWMFRDILRIWYLLCIAVYIFLYLSKRGQLDAHLALQECLLLFVPISFIWLAFVNLCRCNSNKRRIGRRGPVHWALYESQWSLLLFQISVFFSTIRDKNLHISLKDVLFGYGWHTGAFFKDFFSLNWEQDATFPHGAINLLLIWIIVVFFLYRIPYRLKQYDRAIKLNFAKLGKIKFVISTSVIVGILLYFSVLIFARSIYPYIPYAKGGGNYSMNRSVLISFNAGAAIPPPLIAKNQSNSLIILNENNNFIFFADRFDAGGPSGWRDTTNRPTVYKIPHDEIASITYISSAQSAVALPIKISNPVKSTKH